MSKEKILDAGQHLFAEKGFEGTSVRALAQAAGVNIAMISYYFGNKESLFEAIVERKTAYTRQRLEEVSHQTTASPVEKLDFVIDYYVDLILSNRKFHLMLYRELTLAQRKDFHDHILDILQKNWRELQGILLEGQDKKSFKQDIDTDMVIMTVFGVINQCSQTGILRKLIDKQDVADQEQEVRKRLKQYLKDLFHAYLLV